MVARASISLDRMRIVQFIPMLDVGGAERLATTLTLALAPRVEHIVMASEGGPPFEAELRAAGIDVRLIPRPTPPRPGPLLRSAVALSRILRSERPHLVHAHNPAAGAAAALARKLARLPGVAIVTTHHGVEAARIGHALRALMISSDIVVGCSPGETRALLEAGLPAPRSATVSNAVLARVTRAREEVRREFGAEEADLVVSIGRYFVEKNHAVLLDALARMTASRPKLRVLLVGAGPLEQEIRDRVTALELDGVVTVTGPRADAVDLTAAADVFALSSSREALPLAVLEALAVGCPVVSTEVGGIPEVVKDGETGLLVPMEDPVALAEALERVLADPALRERLGRAGQELIAREFSHDVMVERYEEVYLAAVNARRTAKAS